MYRAISGTFFFTFFCTWGLRVTFVLKLGRKNVPEGGGHLGRVGTESTEVAGPPLVHFFDQICPKLYRGGGPHLPPPVGGGDDKGASSRAFDWSWSHVMAWLTSKVMSEVTSPYRALFLHMSASVGMLVAF